MCVKYRTAGRLVPAARAPSRLVNEPRPTGGELPATFSFVAAGALHAAFQLDRTSLSSEVFAWLGLRVLSSSRYCLSYAKGALTKGSEIKTFHLF